MALYKCCIIIIIIIINECGQSYDAIVQVSSAIKM